MPITVKLNGEEEHFPEEMTVEQLLQTKGVRQEYVTVELNEDMVDKEEYSSAIVRNGDEVEFIYYMGGG